MLELRAETDIAAPVDRVWQILMDFDSFPRWNPFIRSVRGRPEVGCRLDVEIGPSGSRGMRFHPTVTSVVPKREFRWMGRVAFRGLFDGEHIFELKSLGPAGTRFVQRERFRGLFVPLMARRLRKDVRRGFEEMNQALRDQAVGPPASP
jgi:hypothetical protein